MAWIGKILGAVFGFMIAGPIGALIGFGLGHLFDRGRRSLKLGMGKVRQVQGTFFRVTFSVMGHVCKADGRVSEAEIAAAESVMAHMRLDADQRREAIGYFQAGKRGDFDLDAALDELLSLAGGRRMLLGMFLEIQLQAAMADGQVDDAERRVLLHIAERLGLSEQEFARLEALLRGGARQAGAQGAPSGDRLREAYEELGVSPEASDAEVKRAYRSLMSQHHPDKLVSRGLPESMVEMAKERTQEIQAAYETVKQARGLK